MPIRPEISLQTPTLQTGLIGQGIANYRDRQRQEAADKRANALLELKMEEEKRQKAELDRKEILRSTAIEGQEVLNLFDEDPMKAQEIISQKIKKGGKTVSAWADLWKLNQQDPQRAKQALLGAQKQARFEGLIPERYQVKDPSKWTQESLREFEQTGRQSSLVPRTATLKPTTAEAAVDKAFAKEYTDWVTGGMEDVSKNIIQLKTVQSRLEAGNENLTGPWIGNVPDAIRTKTNPASIDVRDQVEEVVQRNLRMVLGPQFTEKEGIRLIARAYNETLDESVNAKRVGRLITVIEEAAKAKQRAADYYEKNGTLKGYKGPKFTMAEINRRLTEELKKEEKQTKTKKADTKKPAQPKGNSGWSIQKVE